MIELSLSSSTMIVLFVVQGMGSSMVIACAEGCFLFPPWHGRALVSMFGQFCHLKSAEKVPI